MGVRFTEEQRACIEQLAGPVDISAGAGSGKTFTLTQRIAAALSDPASGVDDIDQICAITFTRKAAAELKGRVRSTLRAQGRLDQAMKVDGAWISTIHGMCSRILRAEALELGIDPGFRVLEGKERDDMLALALSEVLGRPSDIVEGTLDASLLREFPVRSFYGEASLSLMVERLVNAASSMPAGFDGFIRGPEPLSPSALARQMLQAYQEVEPFYRSCKPSKTRDAALASLEDACDRLGAYLESASQDLGELLDVLGACPMLRKISSKDEARNQAFDDYQFAHARIAQNAALARGRLLLDELLALAKQVDTAFMRLKRDAAALDNNDLVRLTLRALEMPSIERRYAGRFRMVMVDEFQDTDALQIAIVRHLAGPGLRYLCTVGDAQQSIYRFRGADVNGYRAFRDQLASPEIEQAGGKASLLRLTRNFRSHGDILAFVKKVCEQPGVFGDDFLDLDAVYDGGGYRASEARIQLVVTQLPAGRAKAGQAARARLTTAEEIASYFTRMREAGHSASEMVLLLGGMTHAQEYASALRRAGFECIVAGGSTFFTFPEVSVMRALSNALANPEDTSALFEVLTSEMFCVSPDDLLQMATGRDEAWGIPKNRKLNKGLAALRATDDVSLALRQAIEVLGKALEAVRYCGLSFALEQALLDSGWLARLQMRGAEGMAAIANVLKAVRMVHDFEEGGSVGPSSAAGRFSALFAAGAKDKPGVLNAEGNQAVRIMTIHASKGLEFPLVAVAELPEGAGRSSALALQARAGKTCVSLMPGSSTLASGSALAKAAAKPSMREHEAAPEWQRACGVSDQAEFHASLQAIEAFEEAAEAQRLFYVAVTRAKEAAAIFLTVREKKDDVACKGVSDDIRSALFGHEAFPSDNCLVDYGGTQPAQYRCVRVECEQPAGRPADDAPEDAAGDVAAVADADALWGAPVGDALGLPHASACMRAPEVAPFRLLPCITPKRNDTGMFSYSSLHATLDAAWEPPARSEGKPAAEPGEDPLARHVDSASEPAAFEGDEGQAALQRLAAKDGDAATSFGSAFHRLAQLAALRGDDAARNHVEQACETYGVGGVERIRRALERWLSSKTHERAWSYAHREPELPFVLPVADGVLEGEIDLLCFNEFCRDKALIVDYKTGGSASEAIEGLQAKHQLQGQCYACAVLNAGFGSVEVAFVRVEQDDPQHADSLQQVTYAYDAADLPDLLEEIALLRANSTLPTQTGEE